MIYKQYGKTDMKVSAIGFGGMRFDIGADGNIEKNAEIVKYAFDKGITYFDTAPGYCNDYSEKIYGAAMKTMPRDQFVLSTKCGLWNAKNGDEARERLEKSLKVLGTDYVDIYNMWSIKTMADYEEYMKKGGIYEALVKAREEGLLRHLCITTHMNSSDIATLAGTGLFDGVTLGYNAVNFVYRQEGVDACVDQKMGVVTMNPLGGGIIPNNPDYFDFIRRGSRDSIAVAALKFIVSQPGITVALVGFSNKQQVDESLLATENLYEVTPDYLDQQSQFLRKNLNALCTTCAYCDECPVQVPIPQLMDSYNQYILSGKPEAAKGHAGGHWGVDVASAKRCVKCGKCEKLCTQKLPIIERLEFMAKLA